MRKAVIAAILLVFLLSGCGEGSSSSDAGTNWVSDTKDENSYYGLADDRLAEDSAENNSDSASKDEDSRVDAPESGENKKIEKDMLVYRCDVRIDTLAYTDSVNKFKAMVEEKGGFLEKENYSDNASEYSYYYVDEDNKHSEYTATARIPSREYNGVISSLGDLGDVRSQNSNVENMNGVYSDAKVALEIYEEQEKRYIEMIRTADPSYALQLQNELTELQIKIAQLKSQINKIETDVAYSYINITIREVKKYALHGTTDTFSMRMWENISDSWSSFLSVCEGILTAVIYLWYYAVIAVGVILLVRRFHKKRKTKAGKTAAAGAWRPGVKKVSPLQKAQMDPEVNTVPPMQTTPAEPSSNAMSPQQNHPSEEAMPPQQNYPSEEAMRPQQNHLSEEAMPPQQNYPSEEAMRPQQNHSSEEAMSQQQNYPSEEAMRSRQNHSSEEAMRPQQNHPSEEAMPLLKEEQEKN